MKIEETKVGLEVAKLLKDIGFKILGNQACFTMNKTEGLDLPNQSLVQKWFREVHDVHINPTPYIEYIDGNITGYCIGDIITPDKAFEFDDNFATYEEALEEGLKQACLLVWNK